MFYVSVMARVGFVMVFAKQKHTPKPHIYLFVVPGLTPGVTFVSPLRGFDTGYVFYHNFVPMGLYFYRFGL